MGVHRLLPAYAGWLTGSRDDTSFYFEAASSHRGYKESASSYAGSYCLIKYCSLKIPTKVIYKGYNQNNNKIYIIYDRYIKKREWGKGAHARKR
ncbi:hypothetical protein I7I50_04040 [Histoplasma capsulatum G186AR]|uniref:Uncharacterized protein n=1 Tax=Ajellomyces capsulatus TaxID=5037 RepID=A0A8H7YJM8_AJECA|nr:hypothetical protein I7I52_04947 [Histoplasma capsulatum]QSS75041.1 hypothetical protein I7I50_04040 [Histoplasma capsulatum G186AR]